MKVAFFGGDWYLSCIDVFKRHGHQVVSIFIGDENPYNQKLLKYAHDDGIQISSKRPTREDITSLREQGVECLFSAEYPWLIPVDKTLKTINVHPTLLPKGRGVTPLIWIIKNYPECAGITFHKLSEQFDQGDIIFQQKVTVADDENWETLVAKFKVLVPKHLDQLLDNFDTLYGNSKPQSEFKSKSNAPDYWPKISLDDRRVSWNMKSGEINRISRACGRFGVVVCIDNETLMVNQIHTSQFQHSHPPGIVLSEDDDTYVLSTFDGLAVVMKTNIIERLNR